MNVALQARHHMIDGQLEPNDVLDERVIAVMGTTPRDQFVPEIYQGSAYVDASIPLGGNRHLMPPMIMAKLLQACELAGGEKVLVVAGNTGFSAMLLSRLGCEVVMVEEQRELADRARIILSEQQCEHVDVVTGALHLGDESHAPYDVIVIDGAVATIPDDLLSQLADGGQLVTIRNVSRRPGADVGLGKAISIHRDGDQYHTTELFDASVAVLDSFDEKEEFTL